MEVAVASFSTVIDSISSLLKLANAESVVTFVIAALFPFTTGTPSITNNGAFDAVNEPTPLILISWNAPGEPEEVLTTAQNILNLYETKSKKNSKEVVEQIAFDLTPKETNELDDYIKTIDPLNITPMEAMNILFKIKELEKNKK